MILALLRNKKRSNWILKCIFVKNTLIMRLAQIARKLKVKTSEVITFVDQKFEDQIQNAPNVKIPDAYVNDIIAHFTVIQEESIQKEEEVEEEAPLVPTPTKEIHEDEEQEVLEINKENEQHDKVDPENLEEEEQVESDISGDEELNIEDGVIKAPKVEVKGIKVIGKIELPGDLAEDTQNDPEEAIEDAEEIQEEKLEKSESEENKGEALKVEEEEPKEEPIIQQKPTKPAKKETKKQDNRNKKRSSLTYEEERNLAQKEYRDELKRKKEIEKKKKKTNYDRLMEERSTQNSPKKSKTTKTKKDIPKPAIKVAVQKEEEPKTAWGKFIRWLNT